jgi:hypothetical protein
MDFTSLTADKSTSGSIRRWVNHAEVDSDAILEDAQALIFQTLRIREMRAESTLALAAGNASKALPAGFLDPIALYDVTNNLKLRPRSEQWLGDARQYEGGTLIAGTPRNFTIFGEAFQFETAYDAAATLRLLSFNAPALLSGGNRTNFLTTRYPHILRAACLARAFAYRNNDERADKELTLLAAYIGKANAEADLTYRGVVAEFEIG